MKKMLLSMVLSATVLTTVQGQQIKGSDTMLPLSQKIAEEFMRSNPSKKIAVTGGGSGIGITALIDGSTNLAQLSRKIKFSEKKKLKELGKEAVEVIVAYDALAVVVHPSNKVSNLTREQLEAIFTGKTKNWKELGGADMAIIPYSRETSSGTYEFFKEHVLSNKNYMSGIMSMPATGAIIQSVSQTKGAIGYVGMAYLNKNVKAINISYDNGKTYIKPSMQSAAKHYPIVRPLFYYYVDKNSKDIKDFLAFVLSPKGRKIISEIGFIPAK